MRDRRAHRFSQVTRAFVCRGHEVRGDLRVGFGGEGHSRVDQAGLERVEVLDDPVVDQGKPPVETAPMRMGVVVGRPAVSGPPGVTDGRRRGWERVRVNFGAQVDELSLIHISEPTRPY